MALILCWFSFYVFVFWFFFSKSEEVQATATSSGVSQGPLEPSSTPTDATVQSDDAFIKFITVSIKFMKHGTFF